jgi:hypothetical protein
MAIIAVISVIKTLSWTKVENDVDWNFPWPSNEINFSSVAEPHHFYAAPAPGENFDAAPAPATPAPTLLYSKAKFLKLTKVYTDVETILII